MPAPPGMSQSGKRSSSSRGRNRGATGTGPGRSSPSSNRGSGRGPGGPGRGGRSGHALQGGYSGGAVTYDTPARKAVDRTSNFGTYGTTKSGNRGGHANPITAAMMNEGRVRETDNPSMPFGEISPREYRQIAREIVKDTDRDVAGKFIKSLPFVGDVVTATEWAGMHPGFDDPVASDVASAYANSTFARLFGDHSDDPNIQAGVQAIFDRRHDRNAAREIENARKAGVWISDNEPISMQLSRARAGRGPGQNTQARADGAAGTAAEAQDSVIYTPPESGVPVEGSPVQRTQARRTPPVGAPIPAPAAAGDPDWLRFLRPYLVGPQPEDTLAGAV